LRKNFRKLIEKKLQKQLCWKVQKFFAKKFASEKFDAGKNLTASRVSFG